MIVPEVTEGEERPYSSYSKAGADKRTAKKRILKKKLRKKQRTRRRHCWCIDEQVLCGSSESQLFQNFIANRDGLERFDDYDSLDQATGRGDLVALEETEHIHLSDKDLPIEYRWVRPWVRAFLEEMGKLYFLEFQEQVQINSAVRTREYQRTIMRGNKNAAALDGPEASSHMTGATIDIAKIPMSRFELAWVRQYLKTKEQQRFIEATEECNQLVFHVMIFKPNTDP